MKTDVRAGKGNDRRPRRVTLALGAAIVAATPLAYLAMADGPSALAQVADVDHALPAGAVPALLETKQWLNSKPLTKADLRGKVVLVNFWTYSCINCLRALPHIRQWAAKYHDRGLVVIGVHTPEFGFEHQPTNVNKANGALGVNYPVAIDSDFRIWKAFHNEAWPALYFIDANGKARHSVYGEGDYDGSERLIVRLLDEAKTMPSSPRRPVPRIVAAGTQMAADEADIRSPETYVGYGKATGFAPSLAFQRDRIATYQAPASLTLNTWALSGPWEAKDEYAVARTPSAILSYRFHARDLHLVLGGARPNRPLRFRVTIDGRAPGASHGADTNAQGLGTIVDTKLYQLVRQAGPVADRTFEIQFLDPGAQAYAFTFG
jgi:thiol-disulfide isomerase/thioredoxin